MIDDRIIGKNIRDSRLKKRYTQKNLADKLCVTKQAVSNWENGKNRPDEDIRPRLSQILGISIEYVDYTGGHSMTIKPLADIDTIQELKGAIDTLINNVQIDNEYQISIRTLLEMTLWTVTGFEYYKNQKYYDGEETCDWETIAWALQALIDDNELYPIDDYIRQGSPVNYDSKVKNKINSMAFTTGFELFKDFDDDGYSQEFPQLVGRYAEEYGIKLCTLIPDKQDDILSLYKISLYNLGDFIYSISTNRA